MHVIIQTIKVGYGLMIVGVCMIGLAVIMKTDKGGGLHARNQRRTLRTISGYHYPDD